MRELLYYPNFFIEDESWLKFALLYVGKVVTIVPTEANSFLTDTHRLILEETDLLNSHSPTENEIEVATQKMGMELGLIMNNPINEFLYSGPRNLTQLKDENLFTYELFEGKYPLELKRMLISNGFASESQNGILVHKNMANIYMAILAHTIAVEKELSTITDVKNNVNFATIDSIIKTHQRTPNKYKTLTDYITVNIPENIDETDLLSLIEFRNHPNNQRNLQAFQSAIEKLGLLSSESLSENELIDIKKELFDAKRQYLANIATYFGTTGIASSIGVFQLINSEAPQLDFLREVLGIAAIFGQRSIYGSINDYNNLRHATSYISDIENLNNRGSWSRKRQALPANK
ncbi:hypothetical protein AB685_08655 [Bacillus sp. LL01]|uniref:hypothetical protein n=1 Tax=Bacillus sp. LL01 TaxID=1665556 RepID=UPI00064D2C82|nr:hypothetical protein [Bacillus sp. LL01]KMJ59121.1 hypothetical protein AB685_08655 [Bacillus sp. LL01]